MDKYMYWLDNIWYLGCPAKCRLLEAFQSPEDIYHAEEKYLKYIIKERKVELIKAAKGTWDLEGKFEELLKKGIQMVTIVAEEFPEKLRNIPDPPFALYSLGRLPEEEIPSVAVIGARECSEYGKYIAQELGKCLGENHIQVISGMARGVDGISQSAALESGGISYGIMGCGVDVCYPASNRGLYERLINEGGVISTYPPGTTPQPQLFPPRNRIVSGFADVLVVIEARQKSGTSITVDMALDQGRDIFAVPGRITDRLSDGCNKMLREGAHVFLSPQDFVAELRQLIPVKMNNAAAMGGGESVKKEGSSTIKVSKVGRINNKTKLPEEEKSKNVMANQILSVLDFYPQYVDTIAEKLQTTYNQEVSVIDLNIMLMELCLSDQVKQETPGWFSKGS